MMQRRLRRILYIIVLLVIIYIGIFLVSVAPSEQEEDFGGGAKNNLQQQKKLKMKMHNRLLSEDEVTVLPRKGLSKSHGSGKKLVVKLWPKTRGYTPRLATESKSNATGGSSSLCDRTSDCAELHKVLQRWPEGRPKACIYYLSQPSRVTFLQNSIRTLDKHFNNKYEYPIVIFHEHEFVPYIPFIRESTRSKVYFQEISFTLPSFLPKDIPLEIPCTSSIGYRHMCRFQAKLVYEQPIMKAFEYSWRMDDDSELLNTVDYDVFWFMKANRLLYGYIWKHYDNLMCTKGLWAATDAYIQEKGIRPKFFHEWPDPRLYYNNFEISDMQLWLSKQYSEYIDFIDKLGGIYYHRWGDAPIKGVAVSLFVEQNETHFFRDISYRHGTFVNIP